MELDHTQIRQFLSYVFTSADLPELGLDLLLWFLSPQDKNTHESVFVQTESEALVAIEQHSQHHCYWSVGLREHQTRPRPRWQGGTQDVRALLCLNQDLDIQHPTAHKAPNLPPDMESARSLLQASPLRETFVTHTGYGLQALWWQKEVELLESADDRTLAQHVCRQLYACIQQEARRHGWAVDATHNLTRLLRIPGTINWKDPENPQLCRFLSSGGPQYGGLGDFLDELPDVSLPPEVDEETRQATQNCTLEGSTLSLTKFSVMMDNSGLFARTWHKRRSDLKDQSHSGYDFSLTIQALQADWTPNEAMGLLLAFAKEHKREPKKLAYYKFTLKKALTLLRQGASEKAAVMVVAEEKETATEEEQKESELADDQEGPHGLFDEIAVLLDLPRGDVFAQACRITGFAIEHDPRPEYIFSLLTPDGAQEVRIKDRDIALFNAIRLAFLPLVRRLPAVNKRNRQKWESLLNRLLHIVEIRDTSELSAEQLIYDALSGYLSYCVTKLHVSEEEGPDEQQAKWQYFSQRRPFSYEDTLYFPLMHFCDYARKEGGNPLTQREVAAGLKNIGAQSRLFISGRTTPGDDRSRISVRYWTIPLQKVPGVDPGIVYPARNGHLGG